MLQNPFFHTITHTTQMTWVKINERYIKIYDDETTILNLIIPLSV